MMTMSEPKNIDLRHLPNAVYAASVYAEQVKMLTQDNIRLRAELEAQFAALTARAETAEATVDRLAIANKEVATINANLVDALADARHVFKNITAVNSDAAELVKAWLEAYLEPKP
jgi:hypothetical protein